MNTDKRFASFALLIILGIVILGGVAYAVIRSQTLSESESVTHEEDGQVHTESEIARTSSEDHITWRFEDAGEVENIPYTTVTVFVNGTAYSAGKFEGSCIEVGANGGIDGTGLLAGELAAVQCWFAGAGDEIGVFAHEDGGYDIMAGELSESIEGSMPFRGDFKILHIIEG